jgi:FixJ family two-component response regulator
MARDDPAQDDPARSGAVPAKRLLVIDDEAEMMAFVSRVATGVGFEVLTTASPDEFKAKVASWQPSCVVLDIVMPGIDGIELMGFLARQNYRGVIVAISGFSPIYLEAAKKFGHGWQLGAIHTLTKPIRVDELRSVLKAV